MIEQAENIISELGFKEFRVRHLEIAQNGKALKLAKLDIAKDELNNIVNLELLEEINTKLKAIGYDFVTLDLAGLRSGSLNVKITLPNDLRAQRSNP